MKETLKKAYGEPTPSFHHAVMNSLYHLDDTAAVKTRRIHTKRLVIFGAAAAIVATTAVAAAATNLFGLIHEPVGQYGVSVTTGNITPVQDIAVRSSHWAIKTDYLPEGYVLEGSSGGYSCYPDGKRYSDGWHFYAMVYEAEDYHQTETFVVRSEEKTFNGHKTLISTQKSSEGSEEVRYVITEYFEEDSAVVRLTFEGVRLGGIYFAPNYDEMLRVLEGLHLEPSDGDTETPTPIRHRTPVSDYSFEQDLMNGGRLDTAKTTTVPVGTASQAVVAGLDGEEKKVTIKTVSVTEQDNAVGLDRSDFLNAGEAANLHDKYFDRNDQLVSTYTVSMVDRPGDGISSLAHTYEKTYRRHFYMVTAEVTAEQEVDDLYRVMSFRAFCLTSNGTYYLQNGEGEIELVYGTSLMSNDPVPAQKGETVILHFGIIADEGVKDEAVLAVMTVNDNTETASGIIVPLN